MTPSSTLASHTAAPWTAELLASLDWLRLSELLRAVATHAGCLLGDSRVEADGSVQFVMLEHMGTAHQRYSIARTSPWNQWAAQPAMVETFAQQLQQIPERPRGVLVAPAGYSTAAQAAALSCGIELVDGAKLCTTLLAMPAERSQFYFTLTTSGDYTTPACPLCRKKLVQVLLPAKTAPRELIYRGSAILSEPVHCEKLIIEREAQIVFLDEVHVKELLVRGYGSGHFICDGPITLEAGARLEGSLLARSGSIHLQAEMLADAQILGDAQHPHSPLRAAWAWRCKNATSTCRKIFFEPHG
jgi:hypothetical protein